MLTDEIAGWTRFLLTRVDGHVRSTRTTEAILSQSTASIIVSRKLTFSLAVKVVSDAVMSSRFVT